MKLICILLVIVSFTDLVFGQKRFLSHKSAQIDNNKSGFKITDKIPKTFNNSLHKALDENIIKSERQEIMPDSAEIFYQFEGDTIYGYILFTFSDTLRIEAYYIKDSTGYIPYWKEEYHIDNLERNTGYYISYIGNGEGGWVPEYMEEMLYPHCDVAGFRSCRSVGGRTYVWNSDRSDWRGLSSSTIEKYDSLGRKVEIANLEWNEDLYDWVYTYMNTWDYNINGRVTQEVRYKWSTDLDKIVPEYGNSYVYDEQDSMILRLEYQWIQQEEKWDTIYKIIFHYTDNEMFTEHYTHDKNPDSLTIFDFTKTEYIYNERELLIRENSYSRKSSDKPWNLYSYDEYEYNENDKITKFLSVGISRSIKAILEYDAYGRLILQTNYERNKGNEDWILVAEDKFIYDARGNILDKEHYQWKKGEQYGTVWKKTNEFDEFDNNLISISYTIDIKDSTILNGWKNENLRNSIGQLIREATYEWDTIENQWIGQYSLNEYFYQNGLLKKTQYSEWDSANYEWDEPSGYEIFYYNEIDDNSKLRIDTILTSCSFGNACSIQIIASGGDGEYYYSIDNQSNWSKSNLFPNLQPGTYQIFLKDETGSIIQYPDNSFVIGPTSIKINSSLKNLIYPNPFENRIMVRLKELEFDVTIYDLMGEQIYNQKNINSEHSIYLDNISSGAYLMHVKTTNGCYIHKIIKK